MVAMIGVGLIAAPTASRGSSPITEDMALFYSESVAPRSARPRTSGSFLAANPTAP
jgi:hypothetical protein